MPAITDELIEKVARDLERGIPPRGVSKRYRLSLRDVYRIRALKGFSIECWENAKAEFESLVVTNRELKEENSELRREVKTIAEEVNQLLSDKERLMKERGSLRAKNSKLMTEVENLEKRSQQLATELREREASTDERIESKLKHLDQEIEARERAHRISLQSMDKEFFQNREVLVETIVSLIEKGHEDMLENFGISYLMARGNEPIVPGLKTITKHEWIKRLTEAVISDLKEMYVMVCLNFPA